LKAIGTSLARLVGLLAISVLALQLYLLARVGLMTYVDPESTTFQRSEIWRLATSGRLAWRQQWVDYGRIAPNLKRAVIAAEDAGFAEHSGVEWDALEKAWERNQKAEAAAERLNQRAEAAAERSNPRHGAAKVRAETGAPSRIPKVVGGSTITQQLAKNLFLGGERSFARKGQEIVVTGFLEALLGKQRILEIYLNNVEWGEGVFGAEAAARHYFNVGAASLSASQAARLAVMLPAPKRFEKRPASAYILARAATVSARMGAVELP
jgi:monofunctional biosynthetic peptidoglycan transglycosylase